MQVPGGPRLQSLAAVQEFPPALFCVAKDAAGPGHRHLVVIDASRAPRLLLGVDLGDPAPPTHPGLPPEGGGGGSAVTSAWPCPLLDSPPREGRGPGLLPYSSGAAVSDTHPACGARVSRAVIAASIGPAGPGAADRQRLSHLSLALSKVSVARGVWQVAGGQVTLSRPSGGRLQTRGPRW